LCGQGIIYRSFENQSKMIDFFMNKLIDRIEPPLEENIKNEIKLEMNNIIQDRFKDFIKQYKLHIVKSFIEYLFPDRNQSCESIRNEFAIKIRRIFGPEFIFKYDIFNDIKFYNIGLGENKIIIDLDDRHMSYQFDNNSVKLNDNQKDNIRYFRGMSDEEKNNVNKRFDEFIKKFNFESKIYNDVKNQFNIKSNINRENFDPFIDQYNKVKKKYEDLKSRKENLYSELKKIFKTEKDIENARSVIIYNIFLLEDFNDINASLFNGIKFPINLNKYEIDNIKQTLFNILIHKDVSYEEVLYIILDRSGNSKETQDLQSEIKIYNDLYNILYNNISIKETNCIMQKLNDYFAIREEMNYKTYDQLSKEEKEEFDKNNKESHDLIKKIYKFLIMYLMILSQIKKIILNLSLLVNLAANQQLIKLQKL